MGLLLAALLCADEIPFTHESFDGFKIDAKLALPAGAKEEEVTRAVILVGGSGPYDMDLDLTAVSKDKKTKILWLKDVSDALVARGFATIRYHKRPHQIGELVKKVRAEKREPTAEEKTIVRRFQENPLKHFVDDCKSFAEAARKRFPKAKVFLLGASEGTHVALWAAHELKWIAGVALVGFYARSLDTTIFEQCVYREEHLFRGIDADGDGFLTKEELKKGGATGFNLGVQMNTLDLDGDGRLSIMEFRGACLVALAEKADIGDAYRRQEAQYPSMVDVLKAAEVPVLFFQGLWDNQTPAYNAMAVQMLAKHVWKRTNFAFRYFPKLGHCLDPRESYQDLFYHAMDPEALKAVGEEMDARLK